MEPPYCSLHRTQGNQHKSVPYLVPQGWIQLSLRQSILSLPESVQSTGSPDSLLSGLWKWNSSKWSGVRIRPLEFLQLFCSHEGTQWTIKPTYSRGTANIISNTNSISVWISKFKFQNSNTNESLLEEHSTFGLWLHGPINSLYFKCYFELGFLLHN